MKASHDPEIRVRCMSVLRQLVIDDYLKEGDGYIGIALLGEMTKIPQDPKPRGVIRITQVQPNSPASRAAILVGDRIIGLDREIWYEADMYIKFQNRIKATKPDTRVTLHILRENVILDVLMMLVRRPVAIDNSLFFSRRGSDLDGLETAAKEGYF